jgi:hypothetical protein
MSPAQTPLKETEKGLNALKETEKGLNGLRVYAGMLPPT